MKTRHKTGTPPGWDVKNSLYTRLLADSHRLQGAGYVGLVEQAKALEGESRARVNQAQQILTSLISGDMEADKEKVTI